MFVLDTNHVSELTHRTAAGLSLLKKLDAMDQDDYGLLWVLYDR